MMITAAAVALVLLGVLSARDLVDRIPAPRIKGLYNGFIVALAVALAVLILFNPDYWQSDPALLSTRGR